MHCPNCNAEMPDGARFCPDCGNLVMSQTTPPAQPQGTPPQPQPQPRPYAAPQQPPTSTPLVQGTPNMRPKPKKRWPIVVGICAAVALAAGLAFVAYNFLRQGVQDGTTPQRDVVFTITIGREYKAGASRVPVNITGTDIDGNAVDKTIFLEYEGVDTRLPSGSYQVTAIGSPIAEDGTIYEYSSTPYSFTIDANDKTETAVTLPSQRELTFTPISPEKMTNEAIEDALAWARKDEGSSADVGKLEKAAKARKRGNANTTSALWSSPRFFTDAMARACTLQQFGNMAMLER